MEHRRQLAAILFSDIVGYSAIMQRNEAEAVQVMKRYETVLEKEVMQHGGNILNDYGDGSLCIFNSALEAVQAAIGIQKALRQKPLVPLRIGLHIGEVVFEGKKVMGDGVNIASRIQSLGQANTVLVSSEIYSKIHNHPEFSTVLTGTFYFKGIDEPMAVYAISNDGLNVPAIKDMAGKLRQPVDASGKRRRWFAAGAILLLIILSGLYLFMGRHSFNTPKGTSEQSVAVLYFDNLSGDPSQDYFSAGMTEEIIARLSNIPGIRVKSRQSVVQYRGKTNPIKSIARELGVGSILQGSVRMQGKQVLVTVLLADGTTEETLWSISYSRELHDIFDVQADIARQVAAKFDVPLSENIRSRIGTAPTKNFIAWDLYLKAVADAEMESGVGGTSYFFKAIGRLKEAVALDSGFADAYARMAMMYSFIAANEQNPDVWLDTAFYFAQQAIKLAPDREQGFISLAHVQYLQEKQAESLRNLMKAEAIRPYAATQTIANQLIEQHAFGEAWEWLEKARRHDPVDPIPHAMELWIFLAVGLDDSVNARIDQLSQKGSIPGALERPVLDYYLLTSNQPGYTAIAGKIFAGDERQYAYTMGRYYLFSRNWAKADSFYKASTRPDQMDAGLIALHLGRQEAGKKLLHRTIEARLRFMKYYHGWHAYDISRCYAALEDPLYVTYFEKALKKGWFDILWLERDPFFDAVRQSGSFQKLWKQLIIDRDRYRRELLNSIRKMQTGA